MRQTTCRQCHPRPRATWLIVLLAAGVLGVWGLAGCGRTPTSAAPTVLPAPTPTTPAVPATAVQMEERYGVQLTLVALTASGGLLDVRFRVTDPAKAGFLLDAERMPILVVEKSNQALPMRDALDQDVLVQNQVYFLLYPNTQSIVQQGDLVSIVIGDLKLEHQVVQ
jgi:hypothetical protein